MLWARVETDYSFREEGQRVHELAIAAANRIGHTRMREDMLGQITDAFAHGSPAATNAKA
jgi:hypothetical protein